MGFDVNFNHKPIIKEAQNTQDGGAGNLGYFESEENKKKKKQNKSVFEESEELVDTFNKKSEDDEKSEDDFSIANLIAQIILAIKDWFKKIFKG